MSSVLSRKYWYFDAAPLDDLGISEEGIKDLGKVYVVGGVAGNLSDIVEITDEYEKFAGKRDGRKIVREVELVKNAVDLLSKNQAAGKIESFGTIFHHHEIPEILRQNLDIYQSIDNPNEIGIFGMRGRTFAQAIWLPLQNFKDIEMDKQAVVWIDNENDSIADILRLHFERQFPDKKRGILKVQSEDRAERGEGRGHRISDIIASIQSRALVNKTIFDISSPFLKQVERFDSHIPQVVLKENQLLTRHATAYSGRGWEFMGDFWQGLKKDRENEKEHASAVGRRLE